MSIRLPNRRLILEYNVLLKKQNLQAYSCLTIVAKVSNRPSGPLPIFWPEPLSCYRMLRHHYYCHISHSWFNTCTPHSICSNIKSKNYLLSYHIKMHQEQNMFPPGIEPGTFCVLDRCDNHYTTETWVMGGVFSWRSLGYYIIPFCSWIYFKFKKLLKFFHCWIFHLSWKQMIQTKLFSVSIICSFQN